METRNRRLRNDFWSTIDDYLDELECPETYLGQNKSDIDNHTTGSGNHHPKSKWRTEPQLRIRVVYWLISCATSEAYADRRITTTTTTTPTTTTTTTTTNNDNRNKEVAKLSPSTISIPSFDPKAFPLGFSTGDDMVDRALTLLRMDLLYHLEQEQEAYNRLLVEEIKETSRTFNNPENTATTMKKPNPNRNRRRR